MKELSRLREQDRGDCIAGCRASEWSAPGYHLVDHSTQTEDISAGVHRLTPDLLRRHITHGAENHSRGCLCAQVSGNFEVGILHAWLYELGEAKVQDLQVSVSPQHDVFWLDITMHDPGAVCRRKCPCDLDRDVEGFARLQPVALHALA